MNRKMKRSILSVSIIIILIFSFVIIRIAKNISADRSAAIGERLLRLHNDEEAPGC